MFPAVRLRSLATLLVLMLATTIAACGSGDSETTSTTIEISGGSSEDRRIAADLRAYLAPCPGSADETASVIRQALKPGSKDERRIIRKYGSVDAYIEYQERTCGSPQRISVQDGVITLTTDLTRTEADSAAELCNLIQSSDAADFTPGHTVLGEGDQVLARCRSRKAP